MPKFDKRFIHCVWDESLKEKRCFLADSIVELQERVESNNTKFLYTVVKQYHGDYPFQVSYDLVFTFCYYDPYYDLKVALEQGQTLQIQTDENTWEDIEGECDFTIEPQYFRVRPFPSRITCRELTRWLAQGHGEYTEKGLRDTSINCYANFNYSSLFQDDPIPDSFLIRKWEDTEWHTPTREYMGLEEE